MVGQHPLEFFHRRSLYSSTCLVSVFLMFVSFPPSNTLEGTTGPSKYRLHQSASSLTLSIRAMAFNLCGSGICHEDLTSHLLRHQSPRAASPHQSMLGDGANANAMLSVQRKMLHGLSTRQMNGMYAAPDRPLFKHPWPDLELTTCQSQTGRVWANHIDRR